VFVGAGRVERRSQNQTAATRRQTAEALIFAGFERPAYTAIPNELLDVLMPRLSPAELKVTLYVARRTFGFKKGSDRISASQFERGIIRSDGQVLDHGTGLSRRAVYLALDSLTRKGILLRMRHSSEERGDEANEYALNISEVDSSAAMSKALREGQPFAGVQAPAYTLAPDEVFDVLLYLLSPAELKVLLYVVRRTFGFNKINDRISLSQFVRGIVKRDGTQLDLGTGLTRRTIQVALDSLVEQHVLLRRRSRNENGDEPNEYALNIVGVDPWSSSGGRPLPSSKNPTLGNPNTLLRPNVVDEEKRAADGSVCDGGVIFAGGGVINTEESVFISRGSASNAPTSAFAVPGERYQFTPRLNSDTQGGLQVATEPECNEDAHNIQSDKRQFDKSLLTTKQSQKPDLKRLCVEGLVAEILAVTGDRRSRNFYLKLAWNLPEDVIRTAISDTRTEISAGRIRKSAAAFFTDWVKTLVRTRGLKMP
jgi:DNA-binding transcriptional ArsR family regulator